jgi:hypothetical protein
MAAMLRKPAIGGGAKTLGSGIKAYLGLSSFSLTIISSSSSLFPSFYQENSFIHIS